jgi:hypothetical protein
MSCCSNGNPHPIARVPALKAIHHPFAALSRVTKNTEISKIKRTLIFTDAC